MTTVPQDKSGQPQIKTALITASSALAGEGDGIAWLPPGVAILIRMHHAAVAWAADKWRIDCFNLVEVNRALSAALSPEGRSQPQGWLAERLLRIHGSHVDDRLAAWWRLTCQLQHVQFATTEQRHASGATNPSPPSPADGCRPFWPALKSAG